MFQTQLQNYPHDFPSHHLLDIVRQQQLNLQCDLLCERHDQISQPIWQKVSSSLFFCGSPRERVNPWGQVLQASKWPLDAPVSIIRVQSPDVYDTLAYEVQGALSAQSLIFPTDSSPNNPPESPLVVPSARYLIAAL